MKEIILGILADVDAGKTTLSEGLMYKSGSLRTMGRVDKGNAFLDTDELEKKRGITVFSKEARFSFGNTGVTLVDTPGHGDFGGETERVLGILDYGILVINGVDGIRSHTMTLWKMLKAYNIPVFIFVNKMDRIGTEKIPLLNQMKVSFGEGISTFNGGGPERMEEVALYSEEMLEEYISEGKIGEEKLRKAIAAGKVFPVIFGSALKLDGVDTLLNLLDRYTTAGTMLSERKRESKEEGETGFSAQVYKITRDRQGNRLTHLKITEGELKIKQTVKGLNQEGELWEEKADQIRLYSGGAFEAVAKASAGQVAAVTGLTQTYAGEIIGKGPGAGEAGNTSEPFLRPALTYRMLWAEERNTSAVMKAIGAIAEENPGLKPLRKAGEKEISLQVMGELELDILRHLMENRYGLQVTFDEGRIIYKETLTEEISAGARWEDRGKFARVTVLVEPLPEGSGLDFACKVKEEKIPKPWQRVIMSYFTQKGHEGQLTGSELTDLRISVTDGAGSPGQVDGEGFRLAAEMALKTALVKAALRGKARLLEPMYSFYAQVPRENMGRLMSDMDRLGGKYSLPQVSEDGQTASLTGRGPMDNLQSYRMEVIGFTGGKGRFLTTLDGYGPCHDSEDIISKIGFTPDEIPMDEDVEEEGKPMGWESTSAGNAELEEIFLRTYGKSKRDEQLLRERALKGTLRKSEEITDFPQPKWKDKEGEAAAENLTVIDGYNVIFAWDELKELARENLDGAREAFLEMMVNYQGYKPGRYLVVFDGYKVKGGTGSKEEYENMTVIFTKERETADRFIEKTVFERGRKQSITLVTSDLPVQMAGMGDGAVRMSAAEFISEMIQTSEEIRRKLAKINPKGTGNRIKL